MQNPQNLTIWTRSLDLAVRIDEVASRVRSSHAPGLSSQMRRASSSIPANIAEGVGQDSPAQCARFLSIAVSSAFELESHLILALRLHTRLVGAEEALQELRIIRRMIYAYRIYVLKKVLTVS